MINTGIEEPLGLKKLELDFLKEVKRKAALYSDPIVRKNKCTVNFFSRFFIDNDINPIQSMNIILSLEERGFIKTGIGDDSNHYGFFDRYILPT